MRKLNATYYPFTPLFTVVADADKRTKTRVGLDPQDHLILNNSEEYFVGHDLASTEEFFLLNDEDYQDLLKKAAANGMVAEDQVAELAKRRATAF